jgi:tetratricopeptide (TPR) repeat protein
MRIEMFETTRQFARHKLDESDGAELAHERLTAWAVDLVERAGPALFGPDQGEWLDALDRELPNLRAILERLAALGTDEATETGLRLVGGLQRFWDIRSRWTEGVAWLSDALARPGGSDVDRAKAHKALGVMNRCLGNLDAAEAQHEQAVALYESAGDLPGTASCLNNRGVVALDRAEYARADALFRRAIDMCATLGDDRLVAIVLNNLSLTTVEIGELREAFRLCRRSRDLLIAQGNVFTLSWVDDNLASVLTRAGHPRWAVPIHEQAIRRRLDLGDESGLVWSLEALAAAWTAIGEVELAGRALGFVAAHRRRLGAVPVPYLAAQTARRADALAAKVGTDRLAELTEEGAALAPAAVWGWFTD